MADINVTELRNNLSTYLWLVQHGEEVTFTSKREKFKIVYEGKAEPKYDMTYRNKLLKEKSEIDRRRKESPPYNSVLPEKLRDTQ